MSKNLPQKQVIFYADDDVEDLELVYDALKAYSYNLELVTARDGFEAVSYLQNLSLLEPSPCLIILDLNMPKMNGKEALRKIRNMERFLHIPIVLFTTSSNLEDKLYAEKYDAGFISKPITTAQMEIIADQLVSHCAEETKRSLQRKGSRE